MSILSRKDQIKAFNRETILNAAESLISQSNKGIDGVTMDDIAKASEFTKRTLYQYFENKDQIQFELMIRGHKIIYGYLEKTISDDIDGLEQLKRLGKALYQVSIDDPLHFWLVMDYQNKMSDFQTNQALMAETYRVGELSMQLLISAVRKGKNDGSMDPSIDETYTAFSVWSCLLGMINTAKVKHNYMVYGHKIQIEKWLETTFSMILNSIRKA